MEKLRDEGIDRFHVVERLAAALEITERNPVDRKVILDERPIASNDTAEGR